MLCLIRRRASFVLSLCAVMGLLLAAGCSRQEPGSAAKPGQGPSGAPLAVGDDAQKNLQAEHERLMAQARDALRQKDFTAALELLRRARNAQDTPQVREEISRVCVTLADQAKELPDKIDLLSQAAEASPSAEINRVLAETKQRLRDQTASAYADTLKRANAAADKGAWQDAVAAASEALRIAALQQLDPASAEQILVKAKEQLNLQAQFEAALQEGAKAEAASQYAAAAQTYAKASALAGQMPSMSAAILNDLKAKAKEMQDRQAFDEASAEWDKAAKSGEWTKASQCLAKMKTLAASLKPAPAGADALSSREAQTSAGLRRDEGLRRLAQAADELKRDEISASKTSLAEASRLLGPSAAVESLGRDIQARASQLGAYVEALAEAEKLWAQAQAVDDNAAERLASAMAAARKALQVGPQCEPPPATLDAARNLLASMRKLADTRRAALVTQAAQARASRNPAAALRLLEQAALLATPPTPAKPASSASRPKPSAPASPARRTTPRASKRATRPRPRAAWTKPSRTTSKPAPWPRTPPPKPNSASRRCATAPRAPLSTPKLWPPPKNWNRPKRPPWSSLWPGAAPSAWAAP
ncbi:MAG TPA: hypothetical protein P5137_02550 [Candidatus Brocadiia bacterium]|nr:hypothetical protein [Candidatus Brocadiia bacterium]